MAKSKFHIILLFLVLSVVSSSFSLARDDDGLPAVTIIEARDLQADAQLARERHLPILLYFASDYCGYCRYVEEWQIKPMLRNRDYDTKIMVRRVNLSSAGNVVNFDGTALSADDLASRYHAPMTPTLVFIDAQGNEVAPRIVGVASEDFYGGDLDNSIDTALQNIRHVALNTNP